MGKCLKVHPGEGAAEEEVSASSEEEASPGKQRLSSSGSKEYRRDSGISEGEAAFLEQQGPSLSREGSRLMARLRLRREFKSLGK